jgi:hypothetical protein
MTVSKNPMPHLQGSPTWRGRPAHVLSNLFSDTNFTKHDKGKKLLHCSNRSRCQAMFWSALLPQTARNDGLSAISPVPYRSRETVAKNREHDRFTQHRAVVEATVSFESGGRNA